MITFIKKILYLKKMINSLRWAALHSESLIAAHEQGVENIEECQYSRKEHALFVCEYNEFLGPWAKWKLSSNPRTWETIDELSTESPH